MFDRIQSLEYGRLALAIAASAVLVFHHQYKDMGHLAKVSQEAIATVGEYRARTGRAKRPTDTIHEHLVTYDGHKKRIELSEQMPEDPEILVTYDPNNPDDAFLGTAS